MHHTSPIMMNPYSASHCSDSSLALQLGTESNWSLLDSKHAPAPPVGRIQPIHPSRCVIAAAQECLTISPQLFHALWYRSAITTVHSLHLVPTDLYRSCHSSRRLLPSILTSSLCSLRTNYRLTRSLRGLGKGGGIYRRYQIILNDAASARQPPYSPDPSFGLRSTKRLAFRRCGQDFWR